MTNPDPTCLNPVLALAAAVEHVDAGRADEIELEWWQDSPMGSAAGDRRLTITVSNMHAVTVREHAPPPACSCRPPDPEPASSSVPDDLSGLEGA